MCTKKLLLPAIPCIIALLLLPSAFLYSYEAGSGTALFPENTEIREEIYPLMTGDNKEALGVLPAFEVLESTGVRVNFFTERITGGEGDFLYFCFSHGTELDFERGTAGSYIIKKDLSSRDEINYGILQIKIFLRNDDNSFLRIKPASDPSESVMEIHLLGRVMQQDIRLPLSLSEISRIPFSDVADLTSSYVDWNFYLPDFRKFYNSDVRELVQTIRPLLVYLKDADDGAVSEDGRFVYIDNLQPQEGTGGLNCSGFVKWIMDGLYKPVTGKNMNIGYLKVKHLELRGNDWSEKLEESLDPYFGLDWTRNLAYEYLKLNQPDAVISSVDVKSLRYHEYREDVGFPVEELETVMYELAVEYPGYFYLASLNSKSEDPPYLRRHTHVAAVFPYFDLKGDFKITVLSTNREITPEELKSAWKDNYIHLVFVKASERFEPSGIDFIPVLRR